MKRLKLILIKEFLIQEYIKDRKSSTQIAKIVDCDSQTILNYLRRFVIPRRVMSEATKGINKGNKRPDLVKRNSIRKKLGIYKGKNNPNWKDGISNLPYPFEFNKELKESIRKRDNYTCQLCGVKQKDYYRKLDIHHIDYDKNNLDEDNLITTYRNCNMRANSNRDYWYAYFTYLMGNR